MAGRRPHALQPGRLGGLRAGLRGGRACISRTLLIDADIIAYQAAASNEQRVDWGDGVVSVSADFEAAKKDAKDTLDNLVSLLDATDLIVCLSDDVTNWRKDVYPLYKTNRAETVRPQHLYDMKDWLAEAYTVDRRPRLEADDVMGILSTEPHKGERIIVSADKDMQTVPGLLFNPNKDKFVRTIEPEEAERFMLWQGLTGDQTDGYPGCPGVGPKGADEVLDYRFWFQWAREFKRGPRKGQIVMEWDYRDDGDESRWDRIVAAYTKAGLTEADAVIQVNLARILKHGDMDGNRIIPWAPPRGN
jgi:DNA polymerase-1